MRAIAAGLAAAAALVATPVARADRDRDDGTQPPQQIGAAGFKNINLTGQVKGGGTFQTLFDIDHFEARNNKVWAVGTLHGGSLPSPVQAALPVSNGNGNRGRGGGDDDGGGFGGQGSLLEKHPRTAPASFERSPFQLVVPAQAACPILALNLGPLDLNLLGLTVHLDQVVLNVAAQPGAGNLLGNLLCAVAGLLNGLNLNGLLAGAVANLLNAIAAALAGLGI
ncbi:MAG TPA: hypothetical protein VFP65_13615 [Anaeromyxobacteraceae bacterium]|nr:hypothetical protein [Anaeromyxobacteraceae bacterium]